MKQDSVWWLYLLAYGLPILIVVGYIVFLIWSLITYGGMSHNEVPAWVLWFWFGN